MQLGARSERTPALALPPASKLATKGGLAEASHSRCRAAHESAGIGRTSRKALLKHLEEENNPECAEVVPHPFADRVPVEKQTKGGKRKLPAGGEGAAKKSR